MKHSGLFSAILATVLILTACGQARQKNLVARIPSPSFLISKILIEEHIPQTMLGGRGYSYTATLGSEVGFDVLTLPLARKDILAAGKQYCDLSQTQFSRFFSFEQVYPGARSYRLYFNCA